MNRVKSLSKSGNPKKDQVPGPATKESSLASSTSVELEDLNDQNQDVKTAGTGRRVPENSYNYSADFDRHPYSMPPPNYTFNGREENMATSGYVDKEKVDMKNNCGGSTSLKSSSSVQNLSNTLEDEKVQKVSPPRRKVIREEKPEKQSNWPKKDAGSNMTTFGYKQQQHMYDSNLNNVASKQYEQEPPCHDGEINAVLEVGIGLLWSCFTLSYLC